MSGTDQPAPFYQVAKFYLSVSDLLCMERISGETLHAFLAAALALILMAIPVAAGENAILQGGTAFIGEENLDITGTGATAGATLAWYGTRGQVSNVPAAQVTVADPAAFYISPVTFGGKTGPWFLMPQNTLAFSVEEPRLEIRVVDYSSNFVVSPSANWVPKGDAAGFRVDTNLWVMANRPGTAGAPLAIRLTGPGDLRFSSLAGYPLDRVVVSTSPFETGPIWVTGGPEYPIGDYSVYARCDANQMADNYPVTGRAISEKVTFLLQRVNPLITGTTVFPATTLTAPPPAASPIESLPETPATSLPTTVPVTTTESTPLPTPTAAPGFTVTVVVLAISGTLALLPKKRRS